MAGSGTGGTTLKTPQEEGFFVFNEFECEPKTLILHYDLFIFKIFFASVQVLQGIGRKNN
jgi:hypothetical protein